MTPAQGRRVGIAFKVSTLGVGFDVATPLAQRVNVRGGVNMFTYTQGLSEDGIDYAGELRLRSADVYLDWFPSGGGFHLSPGLVVYNDNLVSMTASVPGARRISLGDTDYLATSLEGGGQIDFQRVAPALLLGWGNLVPRHRRHWSVPFELGVVYQGAPRVSLNLTGTVCDVSGANCRSIASDPTVQANVTAEQSSLSDSISVFKFYPVISIGFSYRFGG